VPKPLDANAFTVRDQIVIELRSDWDSGGRTWPQGALLAIDFERFMAGERDVRDAVPADRPPPRWTA
jgi:prolyl oligopeptidase